MNFNVLFTFFSSFVPVESTKNNSEKCQQQINHKNCQQQFYNSKQRQIYRRSSRYGSVRSFNGMSKQNI
jgi:hypothetical protein